MTYKTVMVVADAAKGCEQRIRLAAHLAKVFDALLLGVAAEAISGFFYSALSKADGASAQLIIKAQDTLLQEDLHKAERHFHSATSTLAQSVEWSATEGDTLTTINELACRADLIVAGPRAGNDLNFTRGEGAADLLLTTGRPVLVAPPGLDQFDIGTMMIAWKDTREARRAVADALPMLQRARRVVLAWAPETERVHGDDASISRISAYLARHRVSAQIEVIANQGESVGERLIKAAGRAGAGVIVAGAYGHSRLREWAWGGVSERLIQASPIATLMSH